MEENKEEALKCLKIVTHLLESGDFIRGEEFLQKARRLYPSIVKDDLFSYLKANQTTTHGTSGARRRVPPSPTYTIHQLNVIQKIMINKKDYYQILGLNKSCSTKDAHKAYKKLCLEVHPDKNNAPGAGEAFKMVCEAFQCLSNAESRKKYDDRIGSEEPIYYYNTRNNGGCGGGVNEYHDEESILLGVLVPALTILFVIVSVVYYFTGFSPSERSIYSMWMSDTYNYSFTTTNGVSFYARSANFEERYPPNSPERILIERQVVSDHHFDLFDNCLREMNQFRHLNNTRGGWGNRRETPHCDRLGRFEALLS